MSPGPLPATGPASTSASAGDRLGRVQSLVRGLALLDYLADHQDGLTLTEIARLSSLPRSTAHRLLNTMEALRYVAFDLERGRWVAGLQAINLRGAVSQSRDLGRLARPTLRGLMLEVGEAVTLSVPRKDRLRCVEHIPARQVGPAPRINGYALMHTTAAGKSILAALPPTGLEAFLADRQLARRTPASITDPLKLGVELERVRARRYAIENEEDVDGECAVAAAVVDTQGRPRAAVTISFARRRLTRDLTEAFGTAAVAAANRLTRELGWWLAS